MPLLPSAGVILLTSSLADQLATVRLVERRFLVATSSPSGSRSCSAAPLQPCTRAASAGSSALRTGSPRASSTSRSSDTGDDELGELAAAFDRMRVQLAQLDTARKEFVANASHELRTPLFSLAGFLELMADEDLDEETRRQFLATTREQVDRLTRLAGDLLDLSRMDAGRLRVEREDVSTRRGGGHARRGAGPARARRRATGSSSSADESVWALADEERVLQVARALAGNALAHTPPGTRVVISTRRAGDRALLEVSDDGPGIAPEHLERVFDRFYRVEGDTGVWERARAGDRARAGAAHGWHGHRRDAARADGVRASAARGASAAPARAG